MVDSLLYNPVVIVFYGCFIFVVAIIYIATDAPLIRKMEYLVAEMAMFLNVIGIYKNSYFLKDIAGFLFFVSMIIWLMRVIRKRRRKKHSKLMNPFSKH